MENCQKPLHKLPKAERLHSHNAIQGLFTNGKSFYIYPFKVIVLERLPDSQLPEVRILISVSKKKIKLAVARNRIKRLIREGWRKHKSPVIQQLNFYGTHLDIALIFTGHDIPDFLLIQKKINAVIKRLLQEYEVAD
ncbi:MAG: ribonuclease P protein component [Bacteroidales bacterium]|jgi:ribonuclease P protein component|nr:ribonuclease P protein component [Bacteroidales bacterium]MDN5350028.1 ribonuclease protein component [Bacteroidales bacterium]